MQNSFREKIIGQKEGREPVAAKEKKLDLLSNFEHVEIKKLGPEDADEVHKLMRKTLWESTHGQMLEVINSGTSYGAYVGRMLVGVGLSWPAHYDVKKRKIGKGEPNALYLEDVALLLQYEGKGIRRMLVEERERQAKSMGLTYALGYISPNWDEEGRALAGKIAEIGNTMEKEYLSLGYEFIRAKDGILALKKL